MRIDENLYQVDAEGFLRFKNRIYVPNQYSVKHVIFKELHDNPYARHLGYQKFITTLMKDLYWPNMKREAIEYIA